MELSAHLARARQAQTDKASKRRASQIFHFAWRSTESEFIIGWVNAAAKLGLKESSLAVRLSQGGGAYTVLRANPLTGEEDLLTVSRVSQAKEPKQRGRPRKPPNRVEFM